jgi:hypothetical protein
VKHVIDEARTSLFIFAMAALTRYGGNWPEPSAFLKSRTSRNLRFAIVEALAIYRNQLIGVAPRFPLDKNLSMANGSPIDCRLTASLRNASAVAHREPQSIQACPCRVIHRLGGERDRARKFLAGTITNDNTASKSRSMAKRFCAFLTSRSASVSPSPATTVTLARLMPRASHSP